MSGRHAFRRGRSITERRAIATAFDAYAATCEFVVRALRLGPRRAASLACLYHVEVSGRPTWFSKLAKLTRSRVRENWEVCTAPVEYERRALSFSLSYTKVNPQDGCSSYCKRARH